MRTHRIFVNAAVAATAFSLTPALPTLAQENTIAWLRAGVNSASVSEASSSAFAPDRGRLTGLRFGLGVTVPVSERVGLQFDGMFSQQGWAAEFTSTAAGTLRNETRHSYVQVAALARVASWGRPVRVYAGAGPALGYQTGCTISGIDGPKSETVCDSRELAEAALEVRRIEAGVRGIVGAEGRIGSSMLLSAEAGYTLGLTALYGGNAYVDDDQVDYKNRVVSVRVGIGVPIG